MDRTTERWPVRNFYLQYYRGTYKSPHNPSQTYIDITSCSSDFCSRLHVEFFPYFSFLKGRDRNRSYEWKETSSWHNCLLVVYKPPWFLDLTKEDKEILDRKLSVTGTSVGNRGVGPVFVTVIVRWISGSGVNSGESYIRKLSLPTESEPCVPSSHLAPETTVCRTQV